MSILRSVRDYVEYTTREPRRAPHHSTMRPLGMIGPLREDFPNSMLGLARCHGSIVHFRLAFRNAFLLDDPAYLKHVLVDNHRAYGKNTIGYAKMRLFMGDGLVTSQGEFWKRQRRIAQPAFHRQRLDGFAARMSEATQRLADEWAEHARSGARVDLMKEMSRLSLRIIASTVLDVDVDEGAEDGVADDISTVLAFFEDSITRVIPIHEWLPTPMQRRSTTAIQNLDALVHAAIRERRATGHDPGDLLSMLLNTVDAETGERMTDEQLRDEVMTMFLAGHETTATALSWCWYLLDQHPQVAARLRAEAREVLGGRTATLEDFSRLRFAGQVLDETMRLYPPAWLLSRSAERDDEIDGVHIPRGSMLFLSAYVTHRNPRLWPQPERFDPERFDPERSKDRPRYAYFPFSGGPRQCIGDQFARMEMRIALATLIQRFEPVIDRGHPVEQVASVTLRPRDGVMAKIRCA